MPASTPGPFEDCLRDLGGLFEPYIRAACRCAGTAALPGDNRCSRTPGRGVLVAFVLGRAWLRAPALNRAVGRLVNNCQLVLAAWGRAHQSRGHPAGLEGGWVLGRSSFSGRARFGSLVLMALLFLGLTVSCPVRPQEGAVGSRGCTPGLTVRPKVWRPRTHMTFRTSGCAGAVFHLERHYQRQHRGISRSFDLYFCLI